MTNRRSLSLCFVVLVMTFLTASPARATIMQRCQWNIPGPPWTNSHQVLMTPIVMDFNSPPSGLSTIAFISYQNMAQANADRGGVLRIIDFNCNQIAQFPDPSNPVSCPILTGMGCPCSIATTPHLAPTAGLAAGDIDLDSKVEIIGVIDNLSSTSGRQLIAFNLVGGVLEPKWCSQPLTAGDFIAPTSAPALANLDLSPSHVPAGSEIIIDNKVFNSDGTLRYSGVNGPRSRTAIAVNLLAAGWPNLPEVITGRGIYQSSGTLWSAPNLITAPTVTNSNLVYPAVADLDHDGFPEIVVVDQMANTLRVLRPNGSQMASALLPNVPGCPGSTGGGSCPCPGPNCPKCGGPPMIGNVVLAGTVRTVIGVASCNRYALYEYTPGVLSYAWTPNPISDPSGETTSTLFSGQLGTRIYYNDENKLWRFDAQTGATLLPVIPNTSITALEGPIIAAYDHSPSSHGFVIVVESNNNVTLLTRGVRIFDDSDIGLARPEWNQHSYHYTNILNPFGSIPLIEQRSWINLGPNTYRVQAP